MDILVLGSGAVGSVLVHLLAREKRVRSVTCGTIDAEMASRSLPSDSKVKVVEVDCRDPAALRGAFRGRDVVINASSPVFNRQIMEACLAAGSHYQDLCSDVDDPTTIDAQLELDGDFRRAGLVGLMCTGISPGVTNILVAEAAETLGAPRNVHICHCEHQVSTQFVPSWSTAIMIDQVSACPLIWRDNRYERVEPLAEPETVFVRGLNKSVTAYMSVGDEPLTIPRFLDVESVIHKMGGQDLDEAVTLKKYGLFSDAAAAVPGGAISPRQFLKLLLDPVPSLADYARLVRDNVLQEAVFASRVQVSGMVGRRTKSIVRTVVYPDLRQIQARVPGATYVAYPTAFATLVFTSLVPVLPNGVYPPETLGSNYRRQVIRGIRRFGARIIRS